MARQWPGNGQAPASHMPDRGQSKDRQGPVKGLAGTWLGPGKKSQIFFSLRLFFGGGAVQILKSGTGVDLKTGNYPYELTVSSYRGVIDAGAPCPNFAAPKNEKWHRRRRGREIRILSCTQGRGGEGAGD